MHNGLAHLSLNLPNDAKESDELRFEASVMDPSRIEPFCNAFVLKVKAERTSTTRTPGTPGQRISAGDDPGADKGPKDKGTDQTKDTRLDIPEPNRVYEKDWETHDPAFDKFTAMRIKEPPDAREGEERYDYFINMDNVHLQTYLKARPKLAPGMMLRFSVGTTLVALAVLHKEQLRKKDGGCLEDMPDGKVDVRERVSQTTCALAPFLLPMIESVSELDEDEDYLSESAGEAA